nr:hypothetical protein [Tanacetum cinerariifolium]
MVDFIEASPLRHTLTVKPTVYVSHIRQFWSTAKIETMKEGTQILATVDGIHRTVTESSLRRNLKLKDEAGISSLPDTELFENITLMRYNISLNEKFTFQKGQFPISGSTLSTPSCNVLVPKVQGLMSSVAILPLLSLQRQHSELLAKFQAHEVDINRLKERVKLLGDRDRVATQRSGDDAPIKRRSLDEGEVAAERTSDDTEEMATVLTSIDAATILASGA